MAECAFSPIIGFEAQKAAHVCVFFLRKSGGRMDKLKLIKLVYMAERIFISKYGMPIIWDELYSLPHGPICSSTLNGIDGKLDCAYFEKNLKLHGKKDVYLDKEAERELDSLSEAELDVLSEVWGEFGRMTASQIRNYTHEHCPEYVEVFSGRNPITYRDLLSAVDYDGIDEAEVFIYEMRSLENMRRE